MANSVLFTQSKQSRNKRRNTCEFSDVPYIDDLISVCVCVWGGGGGGGIIFIFQTEPRCELSTR